jgi:hypothetical protein
MKKAKKKYVLVFSDTHIGSTIGLWPKGVVSESGHKLEPNKFQEWLWECWQDMLKWARERTKGGDVTVVFNGDIIEGIHHKTVEIMSANLSDQYTAADMVFSPLKDTGARFYMVRGTRCHSGSAEITVGRKLGAVVDDATGQPAWDYLKLNINGCVTSFAHHCSTSSRKHLQATQHSVMISDENQRAAEIGHTPARVVCRAHRHEFGIFDNGRTMSCVTGPWQGLTEYGHKVVPGAIPAPAAIVLEYEPQCWLPKSDYAIYWPKEAKVKVL